MTRYLEKQFTLPANTAKISKELWAYRLGLIDREEFHNLTGDYPDQEEKNE